MAVDQPAFTVGSGPYRPGGPGRLRRRGGGRHRRGVWAVGVAVALLTGLLGSGCAYQLGSLGGKDEDQLAATGALGARTVTGGHIGATGTGSPAEAALPGEADLALARTAIAEALGKSGTTTSSSWENPTTGARGTVTPITSAYREDGRTCRDFLASHVRDGAETWLEGGACRAGHGRWEVKRLKPWKRA
ncbi:RT0821/Lpp0805 family surface protein [Rhodoplanes sp. SY1]|uniref:RT0821/Lpp0805 family surface protein n=1 Tax=Rhodoplanes sp. SY1 TaxID=3166646 RepID=UPI0038B52145